MKVILITLAIVAAGCGSVDAPMPLDEFCEAWATAWCDSQVRCDGVPRTCDLAEKITLCYSRWSCLVEVDFALACLDEIDAWDCIAWPASCRDDACEDP